MVSFGLLVIRLVIGAIFVVHGYAKAFGGPGKGSQVTPETEKVLGTGFTQAMEQGGIANVAGFMGSLGLPNPKAAAWGITLVELVGGAALMLGWKTRPAATALAVSQAVAIQKVHLSSGLLAHNGYEKNAALTAAAVGLALAGPGAIALD